MSSDRSTIPAGSGLVLDRAAVPFQAVLTKSDKVKERDLPKVLDQVRGKLAKHPAAYPELIDLAAKGTGQSAGSGQQARHVVQVMMGFLKSHQAGCVLVDVPQ